MKIDLSVVKGGSLFEEGELKIWRTRSLALFVSLSMNSHRSVKGWMDVYIYAIYSENVISHESGARTSQNKTVISRHFTHERERLADSTCVPVLYALAVFPSVPFFSSSLALSLFPSLTRFCHHHSSCVCHTLVLSLSHFVLLPHVEKCCFCFSLTPVASTTGQRHTEHVLHTFNTRGKGHGVHRVEYSMEKKIESR